MNVSKLKVVIPPEISSDLQFISKNTVYLKLSRHLIESAGIDPLQDVFSCWYREEKRFVLEISNDGKRFLKKQTLQVLNNVGDRRVYLYKVIRDELTRNCEAVAVVWIPSTHKPEIYLEKVDHSIKDFKKSDVKDVREFLELARTHKFKLVFGIENDKIVAIPNAKVGVSAKSFVKKVLSNLSDCVIYEGLIDYRTITFVDLGENPVRCFVFKKT